MIEIARTVDITATPARTWEVLSDVVHWHLWTRSITSVLALDGSDGRVGARYRVKQPKFPEALWTVDLWEPPRRFRWVSKGPAMRMVGDHRIDPTAGGSRVTLVFEANGWLGELLARLSRETMERYVAMEAEGLRQRCEARL